MGNGGKVRDAALWTLALIAIAITIAAGTRIVAWLVQGDTTGVWRAAIGLVLAASGGGYAVAHLTHGRGNRDS